MLTKILSIIQSLVSDYKLKSLQQFFLADSTSFADEFSQYYCWKPHVIIDTSQFLWIPLKLLFHCSNIVHAF